MAKLSVIVPAYNAETTLRTAVESILSQQVPGLEIIIVNDGSTDATDKICHALASQNQCIHVITQKNADGCLPIFISFGTALNPSHTGRSGRGRDSPGRPAAA